MISIRKRPSPKPKPITDTPIYAATVQALQRQGIEPPSSSLSASQTSQTGYTQQS